jgi:hypothetical protein
LRSPNSDGSTKHKLQIALITLRDKQIAYLIYSNENASKWGQTIKNSEDLVFENNSEKL